MRFGRSGFLPRPAGLVIMRRLILRKSIPIEDSRISRMRPFRNRHSRWLGLALVASLLLSAVPTMVRLHRAFDSAQSPTQAHALCTSTGLAFRPSELDARPSGPGSIALVADAPADSGGDDDHQELGEDCAYCPLLASVDLPAWPIGGLSLRPAQTETHAHHAHARIPARHLIGWTPRGPPSV